MKWLMVTIVMVCVAMVGGVWFFSLPIIDDGNMLPATNSVSEVSRTVSLQTGSRYVDYTAQAFADHSDAKRVLFFYAAWCPTCRPADAQFQVRSEEIPQDVVLFRTNYDTETTLKQKYGITYQHTFVQVDAQGNQIAKWNGGDVDALLANIK